MVPTKILSGAKSSATGDKRRSARVISRNEDGTQARSCPVAWASGGRFGHLSESCSRWRRKAAATTWVNAAIHSHADPIPRRHRSIARIHFLGEAEKQHPIHTRDPPNHVRQIHPMRLPHCPKNTRQPRQPTCWQRFESFGTRPALLRKKSRALSNARSSKAASVGLLRLTFLRTVRVSCRTVPSTGRRIGR